MSFTMPTRVRTYKYKCVFRGAFEIFKDNLIVSASDEWRTFLFRNETLEGHSSNMCGEIKGKILLQ